MNVIFLDIDYVLNGKSTTDHIGRIRGIDDEKVALLKELVDYSNAIIVLSSSWKEYWSHVQSRGIAPPSPPPATRRTPAPGSLP